MSLWKDGHRALYALFSSLRMHPHYIIMLNARQNMDKATTEFYNSPEFQALNSANAAFFANLTDIVNGRPVNLQNMVGRRSLDPGLSDLNARNFAVECEFSALFSIACPQQCAHHALKFESRYSTT